MNRNTQKIGEALRAISVRPYEVIAGTVVEGSIDEDAYTISVQPTGDDATIIHGVLLNTIESSAFGLVLVPKEGSSVIIGSIDGPGEWVLLKANKLTTMTVTVAGALLKMTENGVEIKNGSSILEIGTHTFRMNTSSETLYQLLSDLITALTTLTVGTPAGVSTVPINVATFSTLLTRLNNLLNP